VNDRLDALFARQGDCRQRRHPRLPCMVVRQPDDINGVASAAILSRTRSASGVPGSEISADVNAVNGIQAG
jgi:hypothetical protein